MSHLSTDTWSQWKYFLFYVTCVWFFLLDVKTSFYMSSQYNFNSTWIDFNYSKNESLIICNCTNWIKIFKITKTKLVILCTIKCHRVVVYVKYCFDDYAFFLSLYTHDFQSYMTTIIVSKLCIAYKTWF